MTEKKTSETQARATKKYQAKNKEQQRIYRYRSYARKFVKDIANEDDLNELQESIKQRLEEIKKRTISEQRADT